MLCDAWTKSVQHLKEVVTAARRVTVCLDVWSKPNLTSSFLGISACFFDPRSHVSRHVVLAIMQLPHPHTGDCLANAIDECLKDWGISNSKVMMVVSDNGSNIVKAIRLLNDRAMEDEAVEEEEEEESSEDDGNGQDGETDVPDAIPYPRMFCMAHTLQLIIKKAYNHYDALLSKARRLVSRVRKSSSAMEKLASTAGKVVICDNSTRWNSTYMMIKRLLELRLPLKDVLDDMNVDSLLVADWTRLEELAALLEPFSVQIDNLQTDAVSLSFAIPAILDLQCHLQAFQTNRTIARTLLADLNDRFSCLLNPTLPNFYALPAASCLLNPSVAAALLTPEQTTLRDAAKNFIIAEVCLGFTVLLLLLSMSF